MDPEAGIRGGYCTDVAYINILHLHCPIHAQLGFRIRDSEQPILEWETKTQCTQTGHWKNTSQYSMYWYIFQLKPQWLGFLRFLHRMRFSFGSIFGITFNCSIISLSGFVGVRWLSRQPVAKTPHRLAPPP